MSLTIPLNPTPAALKIASETPEYASIEDFVQEMLDDNRKTFTGTALQALSAVYGVSIHVIRKELEAWGLTLAAAPKVKEVRGFTFNPHNLWQSLQHHGGAGIDGTTGRATVQNVTI
jgi:hypothetical protein